jgi:ABC-type nitrate/sulfonate/bicarbonate transport system substrate-binding protein
MSGEAKMLGKNLLKMLFIFCVFSCLLNLIGCSTETSQVNQTPIRIGWQVAWATEGQIALVLKNTNILKLNGLSPDFKGFSYGAPLNEAALANQVDVIFTADQPAASLISRGADWEIIARLIDFRIAIIVPANSSIRSITDLRDKKIAIPFGSTAHRVALGLFEAGGLGTADMQLINMDIVEQANIVAGGNEDEWNGFSALVSWDPYVAIFEDNGAARVLASSTGLSVVVMSRDYIQQNPQAAINFLKSYVMGYYYYALHQDQANEWFAKNAQISFDPRLLDISASFERNLHANTLDNIQVRLSEQDIQVMQDGVNFAFDQGLINNKPNIVDYVNMQCLNDALRELDPTLVNKIEIEP